jgi:hypothetical protein
MVEISKIPTKAGIDPKPAKEKSKKINRAITPPMKIGGLKSIDLSCCGPKTIPVRNPAKTQGSSLIKNRSGLVNTKKSGDKEIIISGVKISSSGKPVTPRPTKPTR